MMRCLKLGIRFLFFFSSALLAIAIPHNGPQVQFWTVDNSADSGEYWNLAKGPELNSTSNFVFETVNSLLQHWPNTRYRNGHTLALATVPRGTLLYHAGTSRPEVPKVPEWAAVNPEHSYLLCPSSPVQSPPVQNTTSKETGCWLITLTTTRSLNLLYFDGNSAANMKGGSLDSQDLLLWGEVKEEWIFRERERINELCEWGKKYSLDGFVRMEMDFEVMLCDFTAGVKPISFLNLVPPIQGDLPPGLPDFQTSPYNSKSPKFDRPESVRAIEAGSWANRFPGERRIKIDYSRLISFYDVDLFPSLQKSRIGKERWDHRLEAISKEELEVFLGRLDELLVKQDIGSGIDWQALFNVVTNRFSERLEMLKHVLNPESTSADSALDEESLRKAHRYVTIMLTPYRLLDVVPPKGGTENGDKNIYDWATPIFKYCATSHTEYLWLDEVTLSASEKLLLTAIRGVSKEICRVLVNIWAEGEEIWVMDDKKEGQLVVGQRGSLDNEKVKILLTSWSKSISDLMGWLDWSIWVRCRPECGYEEMCYLPTWPYFFPGIENEEEWRRPQPKCIRRLEPYDL